MNAIKRITQFIWRSLIWRLLGVYQGLGFGLVIFFRLFGLNENIAWLKFIVYTLSLATGLFLGEQVERNPKVWKMVLLAFGAAIATILMYWFEAGIFG